VIIPTPDSRLPTPDAEGVKACCVALYQNDYVRLLLGDSFHPGGEELTRQLGLVLGLGAGRGQRQGNFRFRTSGRVRLPRDGR
jgi:hypothetical protein